MVTMRFVFCKKGLYKYLSHLDIITMISRAVAKSGLKVLRGGGFNPKPRIVLSNPIPLGVESFAEYCDIKFDEDIDTKKFTDLLNDSLPPNIRVIKAIKSYEKLPSLMSVIDLVLYEFTISHAKCGNKSFNDGNDSFIAKDFLKSLRKYLDRRETDECSQVLKSIYRFNLENESENIFLFKILGYAKIFKDSDNSIFKFNKFLSCFLSFLNIYGLRIHSFKKTGTFLIKEGKLATPFEVLE